MTRSRFSIPSATILEDSRRRLLQTAAICLGVTSILTFLLLDARHPAWLGPAALVCAGLSALTVLLARRGYITLGGVLLAAMTMTGISANNPLTAAYILPLFFAGVVLGSQAVVGLVPLTFAIQLWGYWTTPSAVLAQALPAPQMTILVTTVTGIGVWYLLHLIEQQALRYHAAMVEQAQLQHETAALQQEAHLRVLLRFFHHEMQSATTGLMVYLTFTEADPADELAQALHATVTKIHSLSQRMFVLSRDGQAALRRQSVDLHAVVATEVAQFQQQASQLRVTTCLPEEPVWVLADVTLLAMAINTALRNAVEAADTPAAEVQVQLNIVDDQIQLVIMDHGPGFSSEILEAIHTAAQSLLGRTTKTHGSGTGLSLIRGVAHLHGGQATFYNHPEGGAVVTVLLPRSVATPQIDDSVPYYEVAA